MEHDRDRVIGSFDGVLAICRCAMVSHSGIAISLEELLIKAIRIMRLFSLEIRL